MNEHIQNIKERIGENKEYISAIFEQGYLLTNYKINLAIEKKQFPFYDNWTEIVLHENMYLYLHCHQKAYIYTESDITYYLIGHAYNPFAGISSEEEILKRIAKISKGRISDCYSELDDLTGLFLFGIIDSNGNMDFCGDYCALRESFYGIINNRFYISSHEGLVAFLEKLEIDPYVKKLEKYRWYHLYGEGLPGDISHYKELKTVPGNNYVSFRNGKFLVQSIWPRQKVEMLKSEEAYWNAVNEISRIMRRSMELIAKKWNYPAISTTGGRDSKGSLAAALPFKDNYSFYSYNSQYAEQVDCLAAAELCKIAGVRHTIYDIPLNKQDYPEYGLVKEILTVNSNRTWLNHNDIMKRIFFRKMNSIDVEVKSWGSEIGRAFYFQKYGVKKLQKRCTPRRANILNNVFLLNPSLMYETDNKYKEYLEKTKFCERVYNYEWSDLLFLEMRYGRWGSEVICGEDMFGHDITVPYDNRHLGELFLSVPLEKRIMDKTHIDFTNILSSTIGESDIHVHDVSHDKKREYMDRFYYFVSSYRPF